MQEYYFLYGLGLIWIVFAVIQDLKTTEVSNWLNFSLIAFVLGYRAFYSVVFDNYMFFVYGLIGVVLFVALGYLFYYGRVFAGGDAKLLMGLGGVFPFEVFRDYWMIGGGFILLVFTAGVLWTLAYSVFIVGKNRKKFSKEFGKQWTGKKKWFYFGVLGFVVLEILGFVFDFYFNFLGIFVLLFPLLIMYVKAIEKGCMIVLKKPKDLIEGDWVEKDVKVGRKWIRRSVHGLSKDDINLLKKYKKSVLIKEGVPFTPAFLIGYLVLVCWVI